MSPNPIPDNPITDNSNSLPPTPTATKVSTQTQPKELEPEIATSNHDELTAIIQGVFSQTITRIGAEQFATFLLELVKGEPHTDALATAGLEWRAIACRERNAKWSHLYLGAKKAGEEMRRFRLEAAAQHRAEKGVTKGIYYKGVKVDTEQEYSDRLLETLLKGYHPEVFDRERAPRKDSGGKAGVVVHYHISGITRRMKPEPKTIEGESVTKEIPSTVEPIKPHETRDNVQDT